MTRNIYKLQVWVCLDEVTDESEFKDFYFDVNRITGWFVPEDNPDMEGDKGLNIFFDGDMITIKQEPHILEYLKEMFVIPSKR